MGKHSEVVLETSAKVWTHGLLVADFAIGLDGRLKFVRSDAWTGDQCDLQSFCVVFGLFGRTRW